MYKMQAFCRDAHFAFLFNYICTFEEMSFGVNAPWNQWTFSHSYSWWFRLILEGKRWYFCAKIDTTIPRRIFFLTVFKNTSNYKCFMSINYTREYLSFEYLWFNLKVGIILSCSSFNIAGTENAFLLGTICA